MLSDFGTPAHDDIGPVPHWNIPAHPLPVPRPSGMFSTMPPFVHFAIVQFKPRKGDYAGNLQRLGGVFAQLDALDPRPAVAHFPETALTGYFVEGGVRDLARTAGALASDIARVYRERVSSTQPMDVVIGFYEVFENTLFNSAMCVTLGGDEPVIQHVHRKVFLPTYGLFDEERFVDRGHEIRAFDTAWGRAAMLVCEDAWHSLSGTLAALDGAQVILLSAAAPARGAWPRQDDVPGPATLARWERLARDIAEEHGVFVALAHLVGNEGGKTFAGGSMIAGPKGDVRVRAPLWDEAIVTMTLDLADLTRARADMPLLTDLETILPHLVTTLADIQARVPADLEYESHAGSDVRAPDEPRKKPEARRGSGEKAKGTLKVVRPDPREPAGPPPLEINAELTAQWLINFIREEVHRRGFEKGVLGLSGGVDSAVTAYLAARALGPENVVAVCLPYRTSNPDSLAHAQLVIDALGISGRTLDISPAVDGYLTQEPDADATRRGNIMARVRMIALFDLSARHRAIPLGTGNKTERLFGYFTWHADDSPPINPLGDLFKTQVWALARHLGVPDVIIGKPASADLIKGQTDEGDLGISYAKADRILNALLAGYGANDLATVGFDAKEVEIVRRRLDGTHWKRRLPTVAMVSPTAIGESYLRPVDY
jgi:NAD+ synthetase